MRRDYRNAHHLATISHDGRFWDAYLELEDPRGPDDSARGRIAFSAADEGEMDPVRTTTIFIEPSPQEVLNRARDFKTHQLVALLRSSMPPDEPSARAVPPTPRREPEADSAPSDEQDHGERGPGSGERDPLGNERHPGGSEKS